MTVIITIAAFAAPALITGWIKDVLEARQYRKDMARKNAR